jgi:methylaspartate ammonia-lyase
MEKQTEMVESFMISHRIFMDNLGKSLAKLEKNVAEAGKGKKICTKEWCISTENLLDELAKAIYSISEPRWVSTEDTGKLKELRVRVHDLYASYKSVKG